MEKATRGDGEPRDGGARWGTSGGKPRRGRPGGMAGGEPGAGGDGIRPRGGRAGRSEPETGAPYKYRPPRTRGSTNRRSNLRVSGTRGNVPRWLPIIAAFY